MNRHRRLVVWGCVAAVAALVGTASADLAKCQKGIEKNSDKLRASVWKVLAKCKDGYQSAVAKGEALNVKAGPKCQADLFKTVDAANLVSAVAKSRAKLDKLTLVGTCTDSDLFTLGHLPTTPFGDHWSRWLAIAAIKAAYEAQTSFVGPTANIFQALETNGCALCARFGRPPCQRSACALLQGNGAAPLAASEAEAKVLNASVTTYVGLSGALLTEGCQWPGLTDDEIATVSGPAIGIKPSSVLGLTACTITIRSEGFTNCDAGGIQNTDVAACQDSDLTDGNECTGALCLPDPNANTGGVCVDFTTAPGTPGNSVAMSTSQIRIVSPGQEGPDGVACTADDTAPATPPATIVVTTGTASASLLDAGNVNGSDVSSGPFSGAAGPGCAQLQAGNQSGLTLIGAFPGADTVGAALGDSITATRLECQ